MRRSDINFLLYFNSFFYFCIYWIKSHPLNLSGSYTKSGSYNRMMQLNLNNCVIHLNPRSQAKLTCYFSWSRHYRDDLSTQMYGSGIASPPVIEIWSTTSMHGSVDMMFLGRGSIHAISLKKPSSKISQTLFNDQTTDWLSVFVRCIQYVMVWSFDPWVLRSIKKCSGEDLFFSNHAYILRTKGKSFIYQIWGKILMGESSREKSVGSCFFLQ